MPRGGSRNKGVEVSGVFGKKQPSKTYSGQEWTYTCMDCNTEVGFYASKCPNCSKTFDWTKHMLVDAKDYDPEQERALEEARKKRVVNQRNGTHVEPNTFGIIRQH
jgi:predicted ATP-dependent serine protease